MRGKNEAKQPKLAKAAYLKAHGASWDEIAGALGYSSGESATHAVQRERELWDKHYAQAMNARLREDTEPFALEVQSNIARMAAGDAVRKLSDAQVKAAQAAASSLLAHVARLQALRVQVTDGRRPEAIDPQLLQQIPQRHRLAPECGGVGEARSHT